MPVRCLLSLVPPDALSQEAFQILHTSMVGIETSQTELCVYDLSKATEEIGTVVKLVPPQALDYEQIGMVVDFKHLAELAELQSYLAQFDCVTRSFVIMPDGYVQRLMPAVPVA